MPIIENRKFLVWSGAYFVIVVAVGLGSLHLGFPFDGAGFHSSLIAKILTALAGILAVLVTTSALIHIFSNRRFVWLIPLTFTAYVGAFLYGYFVASNPEYDDPPDISPDQRVGKIHHKPDH